MAGVVVSGCCCRLGDWKAVNWGEDRLGTDDEDKRDEDEDEEEAGTNVGRGLRAGVESSEDSGLVI
jgi:hypothetical protein